MRNIEELESDVWELIEIAVKERSSEEIARLNSIATKIQNIKTELDAIEKELEKEKSHNSFDDKVILVCKSKDAYAQGKYTQEGLIVFADSKCNVEETNSLGSSGRDLRKMLVEKGILLQKGNVLVFTQNYTFSSPSAAANTVLARQSNGWFEWKDKNSKTLKDIVKH